MNKNVKLLAAGCLAVFLVAICCLIAGLSIHLLNLNKVVFTETYQDTNYNSDFPMTTSPELTDSYSAGVISAGEFNESECPFYTSSPLVTCGYLGVPEDHADPGSETITLAVAIIHGSREASGTPPLVYLEGGPGGSALDGIEYLWLDSPLIDGRDVILVDQRGTGYSSPTLNCIEYDDPSYDNRDEIDLIEDCRDRLTRAGINLDLYNSQQSAADIEALRLALGYDQIDLLGVSYGTRLALTVMRDFPGGIRSVILDSVYPPHIDALNEEPLITFQAFETLAEGCQADPACRQAYPDLEDVLYELVEDLEYYPAEVELWDDYYGEYYLTDYYGLDLLYDLVDSMYDSATIPYLPAFIYAMYDGDYDYAFEILDIPYAGYYDDDYDEYTGEDVSDSEGAYFSVECYDESWFNSASQAESLAAEYPDLVTELLVYSVEDMLDICDLWGSQQPPAIEDQPVRSDIPTLILNGKYDPVTPPSWAQSAAEYLSSSQLFIFPGYGHAVIDAGSCPVEMMIDFLDNPFSQLSPECFSQLDGPDFVIDP